CRVRDCTHRTEPGCAVRAALERGELSESRLRSYEKLRTENAWSQDAEGCLAAKEEKFKRIAKINRARHKK
ncbi:MAG: ribosome small subunit-dependent GTPase, partial [Oscillibacter sp.]|nr:ribosome small subunit-dependent GTPase [Oscillibacter sp.]